MNKNIPIEFINKEQDKHLITNRIGSTQKAKDELDFEVTIPLDKGLAKVINWKISQSS